MFFRSFTWARTTFRLEWLLLLDRTWQYWVFFGMWTWENGFTFCNSTRHIKISFIRQFGWFASWTSFCDGARLHLIAELATCYFSFSHFAIHRSEWPLSRYIWLIRLMKNTVSCWQILLNFTHKSPLFFFLPLLFRSLKYQSILQLYLLNPLTLYSSCFKYFR